MQTPPDGEKTPSGGVCRVGSQQLVRLVCIAADELVEQALQFGGLRVCDRLCMQAVQAVDGLLAQAEGAVDVALAGALRIGVVGRLVKA